MTVEQRAEPAVEDLACQRRGHHGLEKPVQSASQVFIARSVLDALVCDQRGARSAGRIPRVAGTEEDVAIREVAIPCDDLPFALLCVAEDVVVLLRIVDAAQHIRRQIADHGGQVRIVEQKRLTVRIRGGDAGGEGGEIRQDGTIARLESGGAREP